MAERTTITIHKDTGASEGLTTEDLVSDPDVLDNKFPVLDFGVIDRTLPISPTDIIDSDIQQLGIRIKDGDGNDLVQVKTEPLKAFIINGKLPAGITLEAENAAWASGGADPAGKLIPGDWFAGKALNITTFGGFGAQAGQGYGYLNMVLASVDQAADVVQKDTIGSTQFPMIMMEFPYLDLEDDGVLGFDDNRKITPGNFANIFIVQKNRNGTGQVLQWLGCTDRMPETVDTFTVDDSLKAGQLFSQSVSVNTSLITLNTLSHTKWVYENIFNRSVVKGVGTTGYKRKNNVNLKEHRIVIRQETKEGHAIWHDMKAHLYNTGTHGQSGGDGLIPMAIAPLKGTDIYFHTDFPVDFEIFVCKFELDVV